MLSAVGWLLRRREGASSGIIVSFGDVTGPFRGMKGPFGSVKGPLEKWMGPPSSRAPSLRKSCVSAWRGSSGPFFVGGGVKFWRHGFRPLYFEITEF